MCNLTLISLLFCRQYKSTIMELNISKTEVVLSKSATKQTNVPSKLNFNG